MEKGDFTGFTFGTSHSSDLGIIRVSGGDRYEEEIIPDIKDRTVDLAGVNGEYYFGSDYGTKKIDLEIAFDSLTEEQFRNLRKVFGTKRIKSLIFDERPYKKYMAKLESPIELSYICFDERKKRASTTPQPGIRVIREKTIIDEETQEETVVPTWEHEEIYPYIVEDGTQRIYKGEGKITFICYFPFAKSVYKTLPEESVDWAISSGLLTTEEYENFDTYDSETGVINIYNGGDLNTGFKLYLPSDVVSNNVTLTYKRNEDDEDPAILVLEPMTLASGDVGVLIDTTNELIIGVTEFNNEDFSYETSLNLYNRYVRSGYFFHFIPNSKEDGATLTVTGGADGIKIFYDYLYF